MTAPDLTKLTLPGAIPGLIGRCVPGVYDSTLVTVFAAGDEVCAVAWEDGGIVSCLDDVPIGDVALDLTEAVGRIRALCWLAAAVTEAPFDPTTVSWQQHARGSWDLYVEYKPYTFNAPWSLWSGTKVPGLADLDPADPHLLPDGSRWTRAEALRRVVLHVHEATR